MFIHGQDLSRRPTMLCRTPHHALLKNPGVRAPSFEISSLRARECQQGGGRIDAVFIFGQRVQDLDRKFRISVPSGGRAQTVAYMAKWLLNRCCLCSNPVQICSAENFPIFPLLQGASYSGVNKPLLS